MPDDFMLTVALPLWWAAAFVLAAGLFRRVKTIVDPGLRLLFRIIILAAYAMFGIMPYMVLFLTVPLVIALAHAPRRWFAAGVFIVSAAMAVGLYIAFSRFTADRREAKALVGRLLAEEGTGWRETFASLAERTAKADPGRMAMDSEKIDSRGMFISEWCDETLSFDQGRRENIAGLDLFMPLPQGFESGIWRSPDGFMTILTMSNPAGETLLVAMPDEAALKLDDTGLEAVRLAYAAVEPRKRDMDVLAETFERSGYRVERDTPPEIAQNSAGAILAYAPMALVPDGNGRSGGDLGIEVDVFSGALGLFSGVSRRFVAMVMFDDMDLGLKTAATWLNRVGSENRVQPPGNGGEIP